MDGDPRPFLRDGDAKLRGGDHGGAARAYAERALDREARERLPALFRELGLEEGAVAIENED